MAKFKNTFVSLLLQKLSMNNNFPDWVSKINKDKLVCIGKVKPTDFSSEFLIKVEYRIGAKPVISVLDPPLSDKKIPHVYKGNHLCVFYPPNQEWNSKKYISTTIIPFISSWLYFYEIWLVTGIWEGGGIHIKKKQK